MSDASFGDPEVVEVETDILIVGGGMAACGAAFEARRWAGEDMRVILVDKAAMDRSGAVAQGLSAINTYLGDQTPEDYCRMVSADLMGITRDDLVFDIGRHVDGTVHLFEEWGLPIWKSKETEGLALEDGGQPVRSGKWQIMINGESYKPIVAEAARKALGRENIYERVFIVKMILDANHDNRIAGAVGFSVRDNTIYVFRCKTALIACGGAVNLFRPRSIGEGQGRAWYPVWNAGSTYAMAAEAGAELTMMENRFVPARFKDGYGPVGAWFLLFKSKATNGFGEDYMAKNASMLADFAPYDKAAVVPTCLRNHAMLHEMKEGRGPILMDTPSAMKSLAETMTPQETKHLEAEAWEDFLDMCIGQAAVWAGMNIRPEESASELMPTEPYLLGSHAGCCGIWVSGPEDIDSPPEWRWGYNRMTTVSGLFTAGDGVGASGHKFSSGSHAEGRIAGKNMVRFVLDHKDDKPVLAGEIAALVADIYRPVRTYMEHKDKTTAEDVNPHYILPRMLQMRLQKLMDEYVAGTSTFYQTNRMMLERGLALLRMLEEDAAKMRAKDRHELLRAWENHHRMVTAQAHLRHILFREETRYPGFFYRTDFPDLDEANWKCFVNSKRDPATGQWSVFKRPHIDLVPKHYG
ncbi:MAG: adenylyl-sulfate reductase subunit alpha [Alphaproteobacteria bacterium]|jgi:adenylylsulfate reductase subunit A|nr:adenylyl-sulfate reductase subunit alpha [Alphaproteobacteria bacterium]